MQPRFILFSLLLFVSSLFLFHCNRIKDVIPAHTSLIYPIIEGKYRVTLVSDTTFDTSGPVTSKYFKKEETKNVEEDLLGREVNLLHVFRSDFDLGNNYEFELDRVWYQYEDPDRTGDYYAERIEENKRILVLKFPAYPDVVWNGNLYNNSGVQEFRYENVDTVVTVQGVTYENCVMVIQKDEQASFINQKFAYEIYAPNVGLIKKYDRTMVFDGPMGEFNASASRIFVEEIIEHNYE